MGSSRKGNPPRPPGRAPDRGPAAIIGRTIAPAASSEPEQSPATGRGGEPVEHRLGQVRAGVAGGDPIEPGRAAAAPRPRNALPGRGLHVSRAQLGPVHLQLDAERRAELQAGFLVAVRVRAQAVVEMQPDHGIPTERLDQARSRRGRIRPTGTSTTPREPSATRPLSRTVRARVASGFASAMSRILGTRLMAALYAILTTSEGPGNRGRALKDARLKIQAPR